MKYNTTINQLTEAYLKVVNEYDISKDIAGDYSYIYLDLATGRTHTIMDDSEIEQSIEGLQLVESENTSIEKVWKGEEYFVLQVSRGSMF